MYAPLQQWPCKDKSGITPFEMLCFSGVGVGYHPLGTSSKTN